MTKDYPRQQSAHSLANNPLLADNKLGYTQLQHWKKQCREETVNSINLPLLDDKELLSYSAGFEKGFSEAIALIKLHCGLELDYNK